MPDLFKTKFNVTQQLWGPGKGLQKIKNILFLFVCPHPHSCALSCRTCTNVKTETIKLKPAAQFFHKISVYRTNYLHVERPSKAVGFDSSGKCCNVPGYRSQNEAV